MIIACCCAALVSRCSAEPQNPPADMSAPQWVPFTSFDTPSHSVRLQLDATKLNARLQIDHATWIDLPQRNLPMAVRQMDDGGLFIAARAMFSGRLAMFIADTHGRLREIPIPSRLQGSVFRHAAVFKDRIYIVLYNVVTNRNNLHRLLPDAAGLLQFDEPFSYELLFNARYEIASNILTCVHDDALYVCAEGTRFVYDEREGRPNLQRFSWPGQMRILELAACESGVHGLYQDLDAPWRIDAAPPVKPFRLIDMQSLAIVSEYAGDAVPYHLRCENGNPVVSTLADVAQLPEVLLADLRNMDGSGVMNLGMNNEEGRIAWSQVYYLNGMIDLLHDWGRDDFSHQSLDSLRAEIKARLDIEMWLLDRLLDEGEPGFISRRYSVNRAPALYAVQTGRILRLFKRYMLEVPGPVTLRNARKLHEMTVNLAGHEEQLVEADDADRWVTPGRMYLRWPKGCVFPFDGVGIPFNHQDDWAGGVTFAMKPEERDSRHARAARDIVTMLLETERLRDDPPADYQWHYWWGQARAGWSAADGVSANRPSYAGDNSMAHISYRTIDAMAVLTVGRAFPEVLTPGLVDYFKRAVENDGLYLFTCEDLLPIGAVPDVNPALAVRSLRMDSAWELQNASWAYAVIERELRSRQKK